MQRSKRTEPARLLDVNVLMALTQPRHIHADHAHRWLSTLPEDARIATCPITEASFIRLALNPAVMNQRESLESAVEKLNALRSPIHGSFLADPTSLASPRIDTSRIFGHKQVTDFHLVNLAASSNAVLTTFDRRIAEALAPEDRRHVEIIPV